MDFVGGAGLKGSVLVIGWEDAFSDRIMDHSIRLAKRRGYSILAVNLMALEGRWRRKKAPDAGQMEAFRLASSLASEVFRNKAQAEDVDIRFDHAAGRLDEVAREIIDREGNIDLILLEPGYLGIEEGARSVPAYMFS